MNQTTPSAALDVSVCWCCNTSSAAEGVVWFMRLGVHVPQRDMVVSLGGSVYVSVIAINFTASIIILPQLYTRKSRYASVYNM